MEVHQVGGELFNSLVHVRRQTQRNGTRLANTEQRLTQWHTTITDLAAEIDQDIAEMSTWMEWKISYHHPHHMYLLDPFFDSGSW